MAKLEHENNGSRSSSEMNPTDQFIKATDLTTHIPLPEETAIPAPSRKRNNSLIPLEFMNDNSEGGRERAALATVFGVREYTESKIFWATGTGSRQDDDEDQQGFVAITGRSIVSSPLASPQIDKDQQSITSLVNVLDQVGSTSESLRFPAKHTFTRQTPTISYTLPAIPVVSKFTEDELLIPTNRSSSVATFLPTSLHREKSTGAYTQSPLSGQRQQRQQQHQPKQQRVQSTQDVAPPLVFISYPPAIFDLLKSDGDNRIIVWGPDPQALSASMNTATYGKTTATATATPVRGFSSNTTSTATSISSVEKKKSKFGSRLSAQLLPLKKSYLHLKGRPHSVTPSGESCEDTEFKGSVLLRKAFKRRSHNEKPIEQEAAPVEIPKVIEAATVEKLVEKLTITLDYTFMTDFFLTYRSFISPTQLCKLLILRFRWALENDEEDRRVVRIRTFVVMRHWLLNYFVHDFIPCRELRIVLTSFLNALPFHSLVKQSPRDQRIVKTLKRVVRRLKKVYYRGSASEQRVQVILPPPPTSDQEKVEEMVRAKLSQSVIRRKTAFVNGVDVGDHHHGNMAVQDARVAPVVVIGSVRNTKPAAPELDNYPSADARSLSQPSIARYVTIGRETRKASVDAIKASYLHRMEQQKRYNAQEEPVADEIAPPNSSRSSVTDDSLQSALSPGTTDPDIDSEGEGYLDDDGESHLSGDVLHEQLTAKLEQERWRREEEDERRRAEFFSSARPDISAGPSTAAPSPPGSVVVPPPDTTQTTGGVQNGREEQGALKNGLVASRLAALESQASKPKGSCELSGQDGHPPSFIRGPEASEGYQVGWPPEGLAKNLSKKIIERRKSERNLRDSGTPVSDEEAPPVPLTEKLREENFSGSFEALPYERTRSPVPVTQAQQKQQSNEPSKRSLTKTFAKVFKQAQLEQEYGAPPVPPKLSLSEPDVEPASDANTVVDPVPAQQSGEQQQTPGGQIVSRIAEELRNDSTKPLECDCQRCTGRPDAPQNCRRLSAFIAGQDDERRHSIELRHRRGASVDRGNALHEESAESERNSGFLNPNHPATRTVLSENDVEGRVAARKPMQMNPTPATSMVSGATSRAVGVDVSFGAEKRNSMPSCLANTPYRRAFILSYRSETMAQQFCLIERNVLVDIDWEEMVHCRWTKMAAKREGDEQDDPLAQQEYLVEDAGEMFYTRRTRQIQLARRDREGGVEQVIKRFNAVCQWVASEIVRTRQLDERVKVVEKFIRLAQKCKMFSNFATLVQILLGLQSPSVSRLRRTWARVGATEMRMLGQLSAFTSPMKNWKHIRDNMTVVAEEYGMSPTEVQIEMPGTNPKISKTKIKLPFGGCIPFLGIYLSDLVFNSELPSYLEPNHEHHRIYEANTPKVSPVLKQPLVNFRKHRIIATVIKRVLTFQNLARRYAFEPDENMYYLCLQLDALEHDHIRRLSHEIEP
ncbi:hypothetical protein DFQ30_005889 [Apophysomyces sp. BC1015]|nr:hypothetical protein DFQ30_005889 [Apophysomyces sp. BC1015]